MIMRTTWRRGTALTVILAIMVGAVVFPFVWVVLNAFKTDTEIFGEPLGWPRHWVVSNFTTAWVTGGFAHYSVNSVIVSVSSTLLTLAVCLPAGYVFAKIAGPRVNLLFYVLLLTMTLPVEAIVVPIFYQMRSLGLLDSRLGLTLVVVAGGLPLGVFIMRNFFRDLPDTLAEAASIDGASTWRTFTHVMAPLSRPAILAVAVFAFLGSWNEYTLALLLLFSNKTMTIPLGLTQFQDQYNSNYGALFAGITMAMIPSIVVYLVLQRSFTQGLLAGSVK